MAIHPEGCPQTALSTRGRAVTPYNRVRILGLSRGYMGVPCGPGLAHTKTEEGEKAVNPPTIQWTFHKSWCSINEIGLCSCGLPGRLAEFGPWGFPTSGPPPKQLSDPEAVQELLDVDHLASVQDRIEKLRKKGIVLCRVG